MVSGLTAKSNCGLALARSADWREPRACSERAGASCLGWILHPEMSLCIDGSLGISSTQIGRGFLLRPLVQSDRR
jgi:hypothetical protein